MTLNIEAQQVDQCGWLSGALSDLLQDHAETPEAIFTQQAKCFAPESSVEKIYPLLSELFEGSLKETAPILRNMDARALQQLNNDRNRLEQKAREMEGSLGLALQAIQRLERITLTKAKRALMTPSSYARQQQLCRR